jgi:hypothetical protein
MENFPFPLQDPPKFTQFKDFWFENMPSGNPGVTKNVLGK